MSFRDKTHLGASFANLEMKIVLAGGAMYMQGEGVSPPGKWMKIDKDTPFVTAQPPRGDAH